jgi:DHA3 family tetracycline resistance protein-like MFS transporter
VGAIAASLVIAQRGLPRRQVLWMYVGWTVAIGSLAGYALATATWQAMLIGVVEGAFFALAAITWVTLVQTYVPNEMLGRVSSLDWLVSFGLTPVSFALAGPAADALGVETTMILAGAAGAALTAAFLLVPGIRDPESWAQSEAELRPD